MPTSTGSRCRRRRSSGSVSSWPSCRPVSSSTSSAPPRRLAICPSGRAPRGIDQRLPCAAGAAAGMPARTSASPCHGGRHSRPRAARGFKVGMPLMPRARARRRDTTCPTTAFRHALKRAGLLTIRVLSNNGVYVYVCVCVCVFLAAVAGTGPSCRKKLLFLSPPFWCAPRRSARHTAGPTREHRGHARFSPSQTACGGNPRSQRPPGCRVAA